MMNINISQIYQVINQNDIELYNQLLSQLNNYNIHDLIGQLRENDQIYNMLILKALINRSNELTRYDILELIHKQIPIGNQNQIYQIVADAAFHLNDSDFVRSLTIPDFIKNINNFICLQIKLQQRFSIKRIRFSYELDDIYQIFIQQLQYEQSKQNICFRNLITFLLQTFNQKQMQCMDLQVVAKLFNDVYQQGDLDILILYFKLLQSIIDQFDQIRSSSSKEFCFINSFIETFTQYQFEQLEYKSYLIIKEVLQIIQLSLCQFTMHQSYLQQIHAAIVFIISKVMNQIQSFECFLVILQILQQNIQLCNYQLSFYVIQEYTLYYLQNYKCSQSPMYIYMQYDNIIDKKHQQIYVENIISGIKQIYSKIFSQLQLVDKKMILSNFGSKCLNFTTEQLRVYAQLLYIEIGQMISIQNIVHFEYNDMFKCIQFEINDPEKINILLQECFNRIISKFKSQEIGRHLFGFIQHYINFLLQYLKHQHLVVPILLQSLNHVMNIGNITDIFSDIIGMETIAEQQSQYSVLQAISFKLKEIQQKGYLQTYENTQLVYLLIKIENILHTQQQDTLFQQYLDRVITFYQCFDATQLNERDMQIFREYTQNFHHIITKLNPNTQQIIYNEHCRIFNQLLSKQKEYPQIQLYDVLLIKGTQVKDAKIDDICDFIQFSILCLIRIFSAIQRKDVLDNSIQSNFVFESSYLYQIIKTIDKLQLYYNDVQMGNAFISYLFYILDGDRLQFDFSNIIFEDQQAYEQSLQYIQQRLKKQILKIILKILELVPVQVQFETLLEGMLQANEQNLNINNIFKLLMTNYNYTLDNAIQLISIIQRKQISTLQYFKLLEHILICLASTVQEQEMIKVLDLICQNDAFCCLQELKMLSDTSTSTGRYIQTVILGSQYHNI